MPFIARKFNFVEMYFKHWKEFCQTFVLLMCNAFFKNISLIIKNYLNTVKECELSKNTCTYEYWSCVFFAPLRQEFISAVHALNEEEKN